MQQYLVGLAERSFISTLEAFEVFQVNGDTKSTYADDMYPKYGFHR